MPVRRFKATHPETGETALVDLEDAPGLFEAWGIAPAEIIQSIVFDIKDGVHAGDDPRFLNPSNLFPGMCCRREEVIKRFLEYDYDPLYRYAPLESSNHHEKWSSELITSSNPGWAYEVEVPSDLVLAAPGSVQPDPELVCRTGDDNKWRAQIAPGFWLRGWVDKQSANRKIQVDWKHPSYPKGFKDPPPDYAFESKWGPGTVVEWSYQTSAYAAIVEAAETANGNPDFKVEEIWVWRIYKASRNRAFTFQKFDLSELRMSGPDLWSAIMMYQKPLLDWLAEAYEMKGDQQALERLIDQIPMDGREQRMLNDTKCTKFCGAMEECFRIAGGEFGF